MPLDQFKTQVLLLHSEQSTLDTLSSGFSDRYTVHCATSGTEALNTLVETPINVIISAQKLPGMSGLEALREAKKRSPETIGILLAGSGDEGLEAVVGDEEVFQIVRGNVTSDSLLKLVDSATQQMRLMALAESANDTAASPDEPSEHIIMETSENGSSIISDGTGRMPALNPEKVSAAASVGARSVDVLVLTKDQEFLKTIRESSRGMHTVHYANTLAQADDAIRKHKVGVAVVDAAMVGQKVEQLTQHLRKGAPRLVSIVAGRRDDGEMLMDLINRGKVYRFLLKPVSPGRARLAVEASVKHHLEAPDAAFQNKGSAAPARAPAAAKPAPTPAPKAAPQPAPKATPKPTPQPAPKPAPKPVQAAAPKPAPKPSPKPAAASKPVPRPTPAPADPPLGQMQAGSPIEEGLANAFGEEDSRFAQTVSGILSAVGTKRSDGAEARPPQSAADFLDSDGTGGSTGASALRNPKVLGIAAVAAIVVIGGVFWMSSGSDEAAPDMEPLAGTPSITEADFDFGAEAVDEPAADVAALLDEARLAREAGQVFNPVGSNAIELYAAAVAADPANDDANTEFEATIEEALGMAETALLEARLDDADAALQRVALVDPQNARLPFLTAQLLQQQLRTHLADARAAIRDSRFEDASNLTAAARALGVADAGEIDVVNEELRTAKSEQQVDEVLALATARLEEGSLVSPANDNARYYYELVLSNDTQNAAARQGLTVVASKLVLQARAEIDDGNLDAAEALLDDASVLDPSSAELTATASALASARDEVAAQQQRADEVRRQAEAEQRAAAERRAAEERAEAERLAEEARAAAAEAQAVEEAVEAQPDQATDGTAVAAATTEQEPTPAPAEAAAPAETTVAAEAAVQSEPVDVRDQKPTNISALNRTRYVAPKYPRAAQRRNQTGWVDVVFTVGLDGTVRDVDVRDSEPGDIFVSSAIKAVEKWEFEPVSEDGVLVEKRVGVRMMFALE